MSQSKMEDAEINITLSCGCIFRKHRTIERYENYDTKVYIRARTVGKVDQIIPNPLTKCPQHFPDPQDAAVKHLIQSINAYHFNATQADLLVKAITSRIKF